MMWILNKNADSLAHILKRDNNNFDLFRLLAALAVVFGHAYAIAPEPPHQDWVLSLLHFDYSGSLAVKFFFFLSGLLVMNSFIANSSLVHFFVSRVLRIMPALVVCLLLSVLAGGFFTALSASDYLQNKETWHYFYGNVTLLDIQWRLPGVFESSKYGFNGSLWTLPLEVLCYVFMLIAGGIGLLANKICANVIFFTVLLISCFAPEHLPYFQSNEEAYLLPACFALGALLTLNQDNFVVSVEKLISLWLLYLLMHSQPQVRLFFYAALFYSVLFFASRPFVVKRLKMPFDPSYGTYLYGFPVQQCVFFLLPTLGVHGNQLVSMLIAASLGTASWFAVERPALRLMRKIKT